MTIYLANRGSLAFVATIVLVIAETGSVQAQHGHHGGVHGFGHGGGHSIGHGFGHGRGQGLACGA